MKKIFTRLLLFPFIIVFITTNVCAQIDVTNTGVLYIGTSIDTVYAAGSFTNNAASSLTNNTVLNVKQNVSNAQAGMSVGTGTLYLNGSAAQAVSGSQVFKTYNLKTANSAGITLNNDVSVSNLHTFLNGLITTSATPNYMIYESAATYTGDNDNSHVYGWVKKIGSADFTFPVGSNLYERPVSLTSLGSTSEFAVKHNRAVSPNYTSLYGALVLVDTSEYWTINQVSGSSAVVTLTWDYLKIPVPQVLITGIRNTYYDGTFWRSIGGTGIGNITLTGFVTSAATSAFNTNFTIGSTAFVLPLRLVSLTGQRNNFINQIKWEIANETNIKNYMLQRSDDGANFYTISTQNAVNSGGSSLYNYKDAAFMGAKVYYRLKYADVSGLIQYSPLITLAQQDAEKNFYVIKNPVTDKIDFYAAQAYTGNYMYTITVAAGQVVQTGVVDVNAPGIYSLPLQHTISSGTYILRLKSARHTLQKTILKL
jgi:hypothetical protein